MNYKDFYSTLFERYAGSKKLRGIWYHGTSTKYLPSILSQGLIPYPKEKSWDSDKDASQVTLDRTTYGGIYVTKNLMTAYSAAWRTAQKTKGNRLIVMIDLQSKSLIADEDDLTLYLKQYPESLALWYFKIIKYGSEFEEYLQELEKQKEKWATDILNRLDESYEIKNPKMRQVLKQYFKNEGFEAVVMRTVAYVSDKYQWHRNWDLSKIKAEDIPALPSKQEGESAFRAFVNKLTSVLKSLVNKNSFAPKGRSLEPIRFAGSNKIICIVELIENREHATKFKLHYGKLPQDFINQYKERINPERDPVDMIVT
jgi:hypothetical protein